MTPPTRRGLFQVAALGLAGAAGATGCSAKPHHHAGGTETTAVVAGSAATTIMIIRHAEKPTGSGTPYGITADGEKSDGSLTVRGWTRAGALVDLFAPANNAAPRSGLFRPGAVYASHPKSDSEQRPSQTVTPLATRLGVTLNTDYAKGDESKLAAHLLTLTGATLVSWQHEKIPDIVHGLGAVTPTPPSSWPDPRFDMVWVFTRDTTGWRFTQVPELLLDGDSANPL